jgi:hypothetical protein
MDCCPECIGDRYLRRQVVPTLSKSKGTCPYCGSKGVPLIEPRQLWQYFRLLVGAYELDANGRLLVHRFREDWGMFDHPNANDSMAKDLLAEILDDGEIVRQKYSAAIGQDIDYVAEWEKLRDELMYHNRFFPASSIDWERLEELLNLLTLEPDEFPRTWYRARIQTDDKVLTQEEMGPPPKRIASHGRANPAGIPYLYLASNENTAISEVRPHAGEIVCVADFQIPNNVGLVDLRDPRKTVTPFLYTDAAEIGRLRRDLPLLVRLGEELTRPVVPHAAAIDYTPSQYLCEFIKNKRYQGVVYKSSASTGINLALFDPTLAIVGSVQQYSVSQVSVSAAQIV